MNKWLQHTVYTLSTANDIDAGGVAENRHNIFWPTRDYGRPCRIYCSVLIILVTIGIVVVRWAWSSLWAYEPDFCPRSDGWLRDHRVRWNYIAAVNSFDGSKVEAKASDLHMDTGSIVLEAREILPTVTVGVPAMPRDFVALSRLLRSIASQSIQPLEVLIAASEMIPAESDTFKKRALRHAGLSHHFGEKLKILAAPEKHLAGANRNRLMQFAQGDLITLIDADDEMHPEKIAVMRELFAATGAKCALHGYDYAAYRSSCLTETRTKLRHAKLAYSSEIIMSTKMQECKVDGDDLPLLPKGLMIWTRSGYRIKPHHGHVTCQRSVFLDVGGFDVDMARGQDSYFLRKVLKHYVLDATSIVAVDLPLTIYYPSNKSQMEFPSQQGKDIVDSDLKSTSAVISAWAAVFILFIISLLFFFASLNDVLCTEPAQRVTYDIPSFR